MNDVNFQTENGASNNKSVRKQSGTEFVQNMEKT